MYVSGNVNAWLGIYYVVLYLARPTSSFFMTLCLDLHSTYLFLTLPLLSLSPPFPFSCALQIEVLLGEHGVVVTEREGADTAKLIENSMLRKFKDKIHICPQTVTNNISSTVVRSQLQKGQSAKYLLPDPVIEYIYANKLYNSVQGYFDSPRVLRSAM